VTTHVFVADSPYLDSAVFGVKDSLVREVPEVDDPVRAGEAGCQPLSHPDLRPDPAARQPGAPDGPARERTADCREGGAVVMRPFTYQPLPMRVVFGAAALATLPDEVAALGLTRVLVLCSPEQADTGTWVADALGDRAAGVMAEARMHVPIEVAGRARELAAVGIGGDRLTLWSHPAEVVVEFADGTCWSADALADI
jgi:hypothetical protein